MDTHKARALVFMGRTCGLGLRQAHVEGLSEDPAAVLRPTVQLLPVLVGGAVEPAARTHVRPRVRCMASCGKPVRAPPSPLNQSIYLLL
jgi:hypothetical protein